jgi:hypothetical protein
MMGLLVDPVIELGVKLLEAAAEGHAAVVVEIEAGVVAAEEVDTLHAEDRREVDEPRRTVIVGR